jgi:hypothetical protein
MNWRFSRRFWCRFRFRFRFIFELVDIIILNVFNL